MTKQLWPDHRVDEILAVQAAEKIGLEVMAERLGMKVGTLSHVVRNSCKRRGLPMPDRVGVSLNRKPNNVTDNTILAQIVGVERLIGRHAYTVEQAAADVGISTRRVAEICTEYEIVPPKHPRPLKYDRTCWHCRAGFETPHRGQFRCGTTTCNDSLARVA